MNIPHNKFCVLPWISIEASPIGTVRPCCLADDEICDDTGKKFRLTQTPLTAIQNSAEMQRLRTEFLNGQQPKTCRRCWNEEDSGRTSKRMHSIERLRHILPDQEWTIDAKPLMFLDLKLGNICNLKCRICGSWSSSQYATEEIQFTPAQDKKTSFAYQMLREGAWPRESKLFWNELENNLAQIRYIEFTGGEPFLINEHFDLLQRLVDLGYADQIEIHYNTNGTVYPAGAEEIWEHFKTVEIAFSIDDLGDRFEYQRTNAKWDEVQQNIEKFFKLKRYLPTIIQLQVCTTVNIFNVRYIDQVAQWLEHKPFNFIYWNMMHDAWFFSIASLPETAKAGITAHLTTASIPAKFQDEFDRIITFMNQGKSSDGSIMLQQIKEVDDRRKHNLRSVAPELADLIDYK